MNMLAGLRAHLPLLLPSFLPWFNAAPMRRHTSCITRPHFDGELLPSIDEAGVDSGDDEPHTCTCGWFDSSHELRHGLLVREHASDDCLGTELPLAQWLELHLQGWRGASSAAA